MTQKQLKKLVNEYDQLLEAGDVHYKPSWEAVFERIDYANHDEDWKISASQNNHMTRDEFEVYYHLSRGFAYGKTSSHFRLLYEAFNSGDMASLNDALYQLSVMEQLGNILSPGIGRSYYGYNVLPSLMAANRWTEISKLMPREELVSDPKASAFEYLFKAVYYDSADCYQEGVKRLRKRVWAAEAFLMALFERDLEKANQALMDICQEDARSREIHDSRFTRGFSVRGHAYYNLSQQCFEGSLAGLLAMPSKLNFIQDLAQWQSDHQFQPGKLYKPFPERLSLCNDLMAIEVPSMHLHRLYADQGGRNAKLTILDTDRYERELIELVLEVMN